MAILDTTPVGTDPYAIPHGLEFPPGNRTGIGIIGCGNIVRTAELPAFHAQNLRLVGVYDVSPEATVGVRSSSALSMSSTASKSPGAS